MTEEQLEKAEKLKADRTKLERELKLWNEQLTAVYKLAYLQTWNNNHAVPLESKLSNGVFLVFRAEAIADLQHQLNRLNDEFEKL